MRCLCLRLKTKASPLDVTLLADHWQAMKPNEQAIRKKVDLNSKQRCAESAIKYKETDHYY